MITALLVALALVSATFGYIIGKHRAECEFAEVILWLEEVGALTPLLEVDDEDFGE